MRTEAVINYIILFLLGEENESCLRNVAYGDRVCADTHVHIMDSNFLQNDFNVRQTLCPTLPLQEIDGIPLLFGTPCTYKTNGCLHVGADIIASSFYLLTRCEEYINRSERDEHGRFPAIVSLPHRAGFIDRPIVDEYGRLLRVWLRQMGVNAVEPTSSIQKVYLTHDVDVPWSRSSFLYSMLSAGKDLLVRHTSPIPTIIRYFRLKQSDPVWNALGWLMDEDNRLARLLEKNSTKCESVFFILCCDDNKNDFGYSRNRKRMRRLVSMIREKANLGLHVSYHAGQNPSMVETEAKRYQSFVGMLPQMSRHHYLACREPEDLHMLINAGIVGDFTHAYADEAGFRLGTCRPVHWIDPVEMEITPLVLHPMTVMECTLDMEKYMGLCEEDAYTECCKLIDHVKENNGELVLLWHNTSVAENSKGYQRNLYKRTLDYILLVSREQAI